MKIGIPLVFSGRTPQVQAIADLLKSLGFDIETSQTTTPKLWEKALFLGSNETCLPVRVYVAHCHKLVYEKNVDVLLAPNLWRELPSSSACSKYRDVGGIALRSLSSTFDYALGKFPRLIQPNLLSPKKEDLWLVIKDILKELEDEAEAKNHAIPNVNSKDLKRAFGKIRDFSPKKEPFLENKPRLGIIARRYILEDPLLSQNIKKFFLDKGFQILTPYDLPERYFHKDGLAKGTYYDEHILGEQFLNWGQDKLDGVVILSYFACHPDAFLGQFFEEKARNLGLLSWHFVCDSNVDLGGFVTRFETIAELVTNKKARIEKKPILVSNRSNVLEKKTFITWPYMGEPMNLALKQLAFDLGASDLLLVPKPVTKETLLKGSQEFGETCCPYACVSGCLEETIANAYEKEKTPINVEILMLHGEGPCAFGLYSIALKDILPQKLNKISPDISVGWLTTGLDQPANFWHDLASLCNTNKQRLLNSIKTPLSFLKPLNLRDSLFLAKRALAKLRLAEEIRAMYLLARPFAPKIVEDSYLTALETLDKAKNIPKMKQCFQEAKEIFTRISYGKKAKKVVVVGEIYVALTPYANRYTVDRLLGDCGVQVVEGVSLSHYLSCSVKPTLNRFFNNLGLVQFLDKQGLKLFAQGLRDKDALPFLNFEVGGDGVLSVGAAKRALVQDFDGIVHIYPLNCMPEVIAKPALLELASLYKVPYLGLSFNRETDTERLITEVRTFTALLKLNMRNII